MTPTLKYVFVVADRVDKAPPKVIAVCRSYKQAQDLRNDCLAAVSATAEPQQAYEVTVHRARLTYLT